MVGGVVNGYVQEQHYVHACKFFNYYTTFFKPCPIFTMIAAVIQWIIQIIMLFNNMTQEISI